MPPISIERLEWIRARLKVLDACIKNLTQRQAYYHQVLSTSHDQSAGAMREFKIEELQLSVEFDVLRPVVEAQVRDALKVTKAAE